MSLKSDLSTNSEFNLNDSKEFFPKSNQAKKEESKRNPELTTTDLSSESRISSSLSSK